jgi:hypothetical protein
VVVDLEMGAGDLTVEGGAKDLMEATFAYSDGRHKPKVGYDVRGDVGTLSVRQPNAPSFLGFDNYRNTWDIQFAQDVPMELSVDMGAGTTDFTLGDLMLTDFTLKAGAGDIGLDLSGSRYLTDLVVETGAGALVVDLSGDVWMDDLDARITAGAGDITVIVPDGIGVRVRVDKGLGDIEAGGFVSEGSDVYVNQVYGDSDVVIDVLVEAGVGQITLKQL